MEAGKICDSCLHFCTFAFAVIVLGISADLRANGWDETRVNYVLAASVIATALLIVTTCMSLLSNKVPTVGKCCTLGMDIISMIFLVAGGAAIGDWNSRCGSNYAANWEKWGFGEDWQSDCGRWHAMESFLWISFAFSLFTLGTDTYQIVVGRTPGKSWRSAA